MVEAFFGFKKTSFSDNPDAMQLFASQTWNQVKIPFARKKPERRCPCDRNMPSA